MSIPYHFVDPRYTSANPAPAQPRRHALGDPMVHQAGLSTMTRESEIPINPNIYPSVASSHDAAFDESNRICNDILRRTEETRRGNKRPAEQTDNEESGRKTFLGDEDAAIKYLSKATRDLFEEIGRRHHTCSSLIDELRQDNKELEPRVTEHERQVRALTNSHQFVGTADPSADPSVKSRRPINPNILASPAGRHDDVIAQCERERWEFMYDPEGSKRRRLDERVTQEVHANRENHDHFRQGINGNSRDIYGHTQAGGSVAPPSSVRPPGVIPYGQIVDQRGEQIREDARNDNAYWQEMNGYREGVRGVNTRDDLDAVLLLEINTVPGSVHASCYGTLLKRDSDLAEETSAIVPADRRDHKTTHGGRCLQVGSQGDTYSLSAEKGKLYLELLIDKESQHAGQKKAEARMSRIGVRNPRKRPTTPSNESPRHANQSFPESLAHPVKRVDRMIRGGPEYVATECRTVTQTVHLPNSIPKASSYPRIRLLNAARIAGAFGNHYRRPARSKACINTGLAFALRPHRSPPHFQEQESVSSMTAEPSVSLTNDTSSDQLWMRATPFVSSIDERPSLTSSRKVPLLLPMSMKAGYSSALSTHATSSTKTPDSSLWTTRDAPLLPSSTPATPLWRSLPLGSRAMDSHEPSAQNHIKNELHPSTVGPLPQLSHPRKMSESMSLTPMVTASAAHPVFRAEPPRFQSPASSVSSAPASFRMGKSRATPPGKRRSPSPSKAEPSKARAKSRASRMRKGKGRTREVLSEEPGNQKQVSKESTDAVRARRRREEKKRLIECMQDLTGGYMEENPFKSPTENDVLRAGISCIESLRRIVLEQMIHIRNLGSSSMIAHMELGILKLGVLKSADTVDAQYANAMSRMETIQNEWTTTLARLDKISERARWNEEQSRRTEVQVQRSEEQKRFDLDGHCAALGKAVPLIVFLVSSPYPVLLALTTRTPSDHHLKDPAEMSYPASNSGMYRFINMGPPPSVSPGTSRSPNSDSFVQFGPIDYTPLPLRQNADKKALLKGPKVDHARRVSARAPRPSSHRKDLHDTASPSTSTSARRPRSESNPVPSTSQTRDGVARYQKSIQSLSSDSSPEVEIVEIQPSEPAQAPSASKYDNLSQREAEEIDAQIAASYRKRHRQRLREMTQKIENEKDPKEKLDLQRSWDTYMAGMRRMDALRKAHGRPSFIGP
ncbi:hypothetical protein EVG20_g7270 [Dentipellis fragilis]|uniref:Uncharacterized protein n=1 Tax=Dentipellis fragilis TaxID=205917 RepID=A0A4Y9YGL7_9AGAM|nr:hypothetical protein EVG20_g7270 [Dentipellis fragilis]